MDSAPILRFQRRQASSSAAWSVEPAAQRLFCILVGASIACFGFGLVAVVVVFASNSSVVSNHSVIAHLVAAVPFTLPLAIIGLFGLSWLIQGLRGQSRHQGLFYLVLESLQRLGPRPWSVLLPTASLVALGIAATAGDHEGASTAFTGLLLWSALIVNIGVHELGHAFAALAARLPLAHLLVGPIDFRLSSSGWRFSFSRDWLSIFGGRAAIDPATPAPSARQTLLFAAGGPAATLLLLGSIALGPFDLSDLFRQSNASLVHKASSLAAQVAVGLLAINLFPSATLALGRPTDGYQIVSAIRAIAVQWRAG